MIDRVLDFVANLLWKPVAWDVPLTRSPGRRRVLATVSTTGRRVAR